MGALIERLFRQKSEVGKEAARPRTELFRSTATGDCTTGQQNRNEPTGNTCDTDSNLLHEEFPLA